MLKTTLNGLSVAFERRGSGKPMVLIHGYPLDHSIWDKVTPLLESKADLILPDLRGFGQSAISPADYGLNDLAADIASLLDQLKIEQAVITGHSMGGYVALAFAHAYPQRVAGLGLVSSQAGADAPERKAARYKEADHVLAEGVGDVAKNMSAKLTADSKLQEEMKLLILRQPAKGLANAVRAMAERPDSTPFLHEFRFPVAIVHGLNDALIPVDRAREVKARVKNGTLVEIEGAGHLPMLEGPQSTAGELLKLVI